MKNAILAFAVVAALIFSFGCVQQPQACTEDAKLCPDGSSVSRNSSLGCEFNPCPLPGSDRDSHGCVPSAGYSWCEPLQECIRPWETNCTYGAGDDLIPGSDRDEHGCIASAGYSWCESKQKCIRSWEETCTAIVQSDVRVITENFPPFNFAGKDGLAKGKSTAIVRSMLVRMGQTADIEVLPWSQGYGLALNTSNVALYSTARTLSRDPLFKWVGPIGSFEKSLYASANSTLSITSLDAARSVSSICVVKNDVRQQMLTERGFTNLLLAATDEDCIRDLVASKTGLWFGSTDTEPFSTYLAGYDSDSLKMVYSVEKSEIFIAFSNSTPDATVKAWQTTLDGMKNDGFYDALQGQYAFVAPDSTGSEIAQTGSILLAQFEEKANGKLNTIASDLRAAADVNSALSGNWAKIASTLEPLSAKHNYTLFWYALPDGTYYTVPGGFAAGNLAARPYFADVMAGKESIGTLVTSKSTGRNSVIVAVPIRNGMQTVGMLGSSTYLDEFSNDVASALELPYYMYFSAVDGNGQVALDTDTSRIMQHPATFGGKLTASAMEIMAANGNGTVDYEVDGRLRRTVYGTAAPANWHFVIAEYLE